MVTMIRRCVLTLAALVATFGFAARRRRWPLRTPTPQSVHVDEEGRHSPEGGPLPSR